MGTVILKVKKSISGNTKLLLMGPDNILKSYEEKQSV